MKQSAEAHRQRAEKHRQRTGWKVFLTPSWIVIAILVLMFTYFAFSFLAPWQLGKGERKSETNHRLQAAMEHDPVPVGEVLPAHGSAPTEKEWTHVSLQGHFEPAKQVLLHNRPVESSPAFQVLTPFTTADGLTVLVNRGWVPPAEGSKVPEIPAPPSGQLKITGFVRLGEASNAEVVNSSGVPQTQAINAEAIGRARGIELTHDYVQLDTESLNGLKEGAKGDVSGEHPAGGSAELRPIPLPQLDNGPHLSYGIQWIAFGILAPIGLAWAIRNELRERKLEEKERRSVGVAEGAAVEPVRGANSQKATEAQNTAEVQNTADSQNLGGQELSATGEDLQGKKPRVQPAEGGSAQNHASEKTAEKGLRGDNGAASRQSDSADNHSSERLLAERYGRQRTHLGGGNGIGGFGRRGRDGRKGSGGERF